MQKVEYQIGINYDCSPIIITHYIPEKKERKRVNSSSHNQ